MELKSGKGLKEIYRKQIEKIAELERYLTIKNLAWIISSSESKIRNDIYRGRLKINKMGPEGTKCRIRIPISEALRYIDRFI